MMTQPACWKTAMLASRQGHMLLQASLSLGDPVAPKRMQCTQTTAVEMLAAAACTGMPTCLSRSDGSTYLQLGCLQVTPQKQPMPQMATTCPVMAGRQARCVPASRHCQVAMLTLCQRCHLPGMIA
jgi:hypothetical protein